MTESKGPRRPYVPPELTLVDLTAAGAEARDALSAELDLATLQPAPQSTSNVQGGTVFGPRQRRRR